MPSRYLPFVFLAAIACIAPSLNALLIAYEGFQYPVLKQAPYLSPVTNQSPAGQPLKYFSEFDTHASRAPYAYTIQILQGSIPTQGSAFPFETKGNSLSWTREWLDAFGTIDPNFQFDTGRDNPPIYVSFIIRAKASNNPVRQLAMAFSNGSSQRLQVGVDDSSNTGTARFFTCVASPQPNREYSNVEFKPDTTYFVVSKITTGRTSKDMVRMNVYAPGDKLPTNDRGMKWKTEVGEWTSFLVTDVAISLYGGDAGGLMFDELRIGSSWEAVAVAPKKAPVAVKGENKPAAGGSDPKTSNVVADQPDVSEAEAEESSPLVLGLIGLGIIAFLIGGVAFYLFVIKPGKTQPAKPKSAPPPKASPPKPDAAKPASKPAAKPANAPASGGPKAPPPRRPQKPPPPK